MKDQRQLIVEDSFSENQSRRRRWARAKSAVFTVACLWVVTTVQAVVPPPDGDYANFNTAEGTDALFHLTGGWANTALGWHALYNTTGASLSDGGSNTAVGSGALLTNSTGSFNTASGRRALYYNSTGDKNTASGYQALESNNTGNNNTAAGNNTLYQNTSGGYNTASGDSALYKNTTGDFNTAIGYAALFSNSTGAANIGLGPLAGSNLTTGTVNIDIYDPGVAGESGTIRIGSPNVQNATYVAGIFNAVIPGGMTVYCDGAGHLGTIKPSSARFKENIKPMDKASEGILALKPVTFRYKQAVDSAGLPEFGLIAEEVEKINPALVVHDKGGKPLTVRYEAVNAMLLNEFLKAHRKMDEQGATIAQLKASLALEEKNFQSALAEQQKQVALLAATIKEQAATIQKVSDRLAATSALRVVANNAPIILEEQNKQNK